MCLPSWCTLHIPLGIRHVMLCNREAAWRISFYGQPFPEGSQSRHLAFSDMSRASGIAEEMAQSIMCLPFKNKDLIWIPRTHIQKSGIVAYICIHSIGKKVTVVSMGSNGQLPQFNQQISSLSRDLVSKKQGSCLEKQYLRLTSTHTHESVY